MSLTEHFSKIATACTDPSRELFRQFCYAAVEGTKAPLCKGFATVAACGLRVLNTQQSCQPNRLTEGSFCYGVDSVSVRHIGICQSNSF